MDEKLLRLFREWFQLQFNMQITCDFGEDGFDDDDINALWIGFCAGYIIGESKT